MSEAAVVEWQENLIVSSEDASKALKVGKELSEHIKGLLKSLLMANLDVFARKHADMVKIDTEAACHALKKISR